MKLRATTYYRATMFFAAFLGFLQTRAQAQDFTFVDANKQAQIIYDPQGPALDSIAAYLLAADIERVTDLLPEVTTGPAGARGNVIIIGNAQSSLVRQFLPDTSSIPQKLKGRWERYALQVVEDPAANVQKALVIAGSDRRGTAYGVFAVSRKIGVSPWYWWADVPVAKKKELRLTLPFTLSPPPDVKYRGIFLNDEDWGLQPWAAKTFEPGTGDIGPKTYTKIFELLLRLRANFIWPAMHPSTRAFFHYKDNPQVAERYGIVLGSSHAEPMLRNNVDEWRHDEMGDFNYLKNAGTVYDYWEKRAVESRHNEAVYTVGMRGIHDSGMQGAGSAGEAARVLEKVIADQREILGKHVNKEVADVPQAFTLYKEVLNIYDHGMDLPEDITIVWPDDNYGYIRRLGNEKEQARAGGSGVYYHASYWGRPHDYLWLGTTHPALIREEMIKAYVMHTRDIWVLNVGDIKPLEYNLSLFMDMAGNTAPFYDSRYVKEHMLQWIQGIFGSDLAAEIRDVLWQYYDLAFERRPEFMGWSQTEPTTPTHYSGYNHFYYGDEAARRLHRYDELAAKVRTLRKQLEPGLDDTFFELVYYPVMGAAYMNRKFLYRDKSHLYARQNRQSAYDYARMAKEAYDSIAHLTRYYNERLAGGKWRQMMDMAPRNLPVFKAPEIPGMEMKPDKSVGIAPEGMVSGGASWPENKNPFLPVFDPWGEQKHFVDVYLQNDEAIKWTASTSEKWIILSHKKGRLLPEAGKKEVRIWVSINWAKAPREVRATGKIKVKAGRDSRQIEVQVFHPDTAALKAFEGFVESNGYLSIHAEHFSGSTVKGQAKWETVDGLGLTGASLMASPLQHDPFEATASPGQEGPSVHYDFFTFTEAPPRVNIAAVPTHPLTSNCGVRLAVAIDDQPLQVLDLETFGRSDEWKQNVLRNSALSHADFEKIPPGPHTLKIYMIDPGVILDHIAIDMGGLQPAYSPLPETRK